MKYDYTRQELENCLKEIGIVSGDNLFIHSNIGFFGRMEGVNSANDLCENFIIALKNVVSESGTFVLPTFSYSFCHNEVYNPSTTKSKCGMLTEYAIRQKDMIRSLDPNFSIVAWGKLADRYTENPTHESFGRGSFWERLLESGGKIVCMNFDCGSTFIHYVERANSVPYRFNKAFNGTIHLDDGTEWRDYAVHYVFEGDKDYPDCTRLDKKCREIGLCKTANLGKGTILAMDVNEYYELICDTLHNYPRFLTVGG